MKKKKIPIISITSVYFKVLFSLLIKQFREAGVTIFFMHLENKNCPDGQTLIL